MRKTAIHIVITSLFLITPALCPPPAAAAPVQDAQAGAARQVGFLGTVQSINGRVLSVKNDAGAIMQIAVQDDARLLRIEPGQKSLQGGSPFSLTDLQVGDRVLARGAASPDGKQLNAAMLVAIKKADIAQKQEQEQEDWQKRGTGGLVKAVDPTAGTVTISAAAGRRTLTIQTTKSTIIRRYSPGSVKFDDAKASTLAAIQPGDQLRARGDRSADGQSFAAEEIVSGSFRNIAGTIDSVNPAASTLTVTDLATKHPVVVEVTPDTQLKKLDPAVAQRLALRLRGPNSSGGAEQPPQRPNAAGPGQGPGGGRFGGQGGGDPQQLLARAPSVGLKDFAKGSAVMLVATEGATPGSFTAVTVVGGVEAMLQASTSGSQAILSSAWNLGGGGDAGGDAAPQQ